MKQIIFIASLVGALFVSTIAEAQARNRNNINRIQKEQRHRIKHGLRNGSITKAEAKQLKKEQIKIGHYKQMAKADGRMNRRERMFIRDEQARAGRHIYAQKHDRQFRGKHGFRGKGNSQLRNNGGTNWNDGRYNERQFRHR
jgi:uncharacterized low-complexity protein